MLAAFDIVLVMATLWLGWKTVADRDSFRAIVHFVALGLLVAMAWVRLRAPDVALAEAAVGAGLTGALVLSTAAAVGGDGPADVSGRRPGARVLSAVASALVFVVLSHALLALPVSTPGLTAEALVRLDVSGADNPVTAVLLNYRGYDTLLEIAVLLIAVIAVWSIRGHGVRASHGLVEAPLVSALVRTVVPALVICAAYLLWKGAFAPGGAFQGGALLGGACVLLLATGRTPPTLTSEYNKALLRAGLAAGTSVFLGVALFVMAQSGGLLEYPTGEAKVWILIIESAATVSIGLTLGALYIGGRPVREQSLASKDSDDGS